MRRFPVVACLFLSGGAALLYEVLWTRVLALSFGHTVWAMTTVLVVFMGGLALGSILIGRVADRFRDPVRLYALLELGIGLYCLASPRLLDLSRQAHGALAPVLGEGVAPRTTMQFLLGAAVLLLPTTLMGGTLPAAAKAVIGDTDGAAGEFGALYGANTLGAAVGAFAAGYWLIPALGIAGTNVLGGAISLSVGGFLLVARVAPAVGVGGAATPSRPDPGTAAVPGRLLPWTLFATGGAAMIFQVAWVRSLVLVIGSSTYAYSAVLVSVLLGIALGGFLFARFRRIGHAAAPVLPAAAAVSVFLLIPFFELLPALFLALFGGFRGEYSYIQFVQLLIAVLVTIVPTTLMGMTLPCLMGMAVGDAARVGTDIGRYYGYNTAGAIVGSMAAGFLLVPAVGAQGTLAAGIAVELLAAAALLAAARPSMRRQAYAAAGLLAAGAFLYPSWSRGAMNVGVSVLPASFRDARHYRDVADERSKRLVYAREGLSSTVAVFDSDDGNRWFTVNGKTDGGRKDMMTQVRVAMIPLLLRPGARRVGVVGLGTGVTAGYAGCFEGVEAIDVVELEPAVVEAAACFEPENCGVLKDPRTRIAINDGRSFFGSRRGLYDVVVSEPSNPWISGVSNLYTVEFFRLVRDSLTRGGLFGLWVQCYGIDSGSYALVLRTFLDVFPDATLWQVGPGDTLIVGVRDATGPFDLGSIRARLGGSPKLSAALGIAGPVPIDPLLMCYVLGDDGMRRLAGAGPLNTDDRNRLEFAAPRSLYRSEMGRIFWEMASRKGDSLPPFMRSAGADQEAFHRRAGERHYRDGDHAMAWWELRRLPSLAPRPTGKPGPASVPEGGIREDFDGPPAMTYVPATTADRPEAADIDRWVAYQADLAWIAATGGIARGEGTGGSAALLLTAGREVPLGYQVAIEAAPRTGYEFRCRVRGVSGDRMTAGIDIMEYDRTDDDGSQPAAVFNRMHLVAGSTPLYATGIRGWNDFSHRLTTSDRSALIRLHFYVEGETGGSVAFDDISVKRLAAQGGAGRGAGR